MSDLVNRQYLGPLTIEADVAEVIDNIADPGTAKWLKETLTRVGLVSLEPISVFAADPAPEFHIIFVQLLEKSNDPPEYDSLALPLMALQSAARSFIPRSQANAVPKSSVRLVQTKRGPVFIRDMSRRLNGLALSQSTKRKELAQWPGYQQGAASSSDGRGLLGCDLGDLPSDTTPSNSETEFTLSKSSLGGNLSQDSMNRKVDNVGTRKGYIFEGRNFFG